MSTPYPARSPLPDLIEESLDEGRFLWRRWEGELTSLTRCLDEVWSWTEDRLHGALAGVLVSGEQLAGLCEADLASEDLSNATVSAALLAMRDERRSIGQLCEALRAAHGAQLDALARGVEVTGCKAALSAAARVLTNGDPESAATLCRLKSFRQVAAGREMVVAFESDVPAHKARAMRAARHVAEEQLKEWLEAGLESPDELVRLAAIEVGIARGSRSAWHAALAAAERLRPDSAPCLRLVALLGGAEQHELVYSALRVPALQTAAVWALGHIGTRRAIECCLQGMKHETLARQAGEVYCHITGADLARDHLATSEPVPESPSFEEEDLDADLVPAPESLWPAPDVEAVRGHWQSIEAAYAPDARYVRGRIADREALIEAVETGPMLRRPDLILELGARSKGAYDVEARAFASTQRAMMARGRVALAQSGSG